MIVYIAVLGGLCLYLGISGAVVEILMPQLKNARQKI